MRRLSAFAFASACALAWAVEAQATTICLADTGSHAWTVPSDWRNEGAVIYALAAGGNGAVGASGIGGGGGGAGLLFKNADTPAFSPGQSIPYQVGVGGGTWTAAGTGATWLCGGTSACASNSGFPATIVGVSGAASGAASPAGDNYGSSAGVYNTGTEVPANAFGGNGDANGAGGGGGATGLTARGSRGASSGTSGCTGGAAACGGDGGTGGGVAASAGVGATSASAATAGGDGGLLTPDEPCGPNSTGGTAGQWIYSGGGGGGGANAANLNGADGGGYGAGGGGAFNDGASAGAPGHGSQGVIIINYTPACPQGTAYDDGCTESPGGDFIQPDFAAHARQSGQTWTSDHPWAWNAPGVDYAVGYYTPTASLMDPTVSPPPGCSLQAGALGGQKVVCSGPGPLTISGYDFSLHNCIPLEIYGVTTGTITITDNKFGGGSNCSTVDATAVGSIASGGALSLTSVSGTVQNGDFIQGGAVINSGTTISFNGGGSGGAGTYALSRTSWSGVSTDPGPTNYTIGRYDFGNVGALVYIHNGTTVPVDFENNYLDACGAVYAGACSTAYPMSLDGAAVLWTSNDVTLKYNVFLHTPARPVSTVSFGTLLAEYNYIEDFVYTKTDGHGEFIVNAVGPGTVTKKQFSYNVVLEGSGVLAQGGESSLWLGGGTGDSSNTTITTSAVDHNVTIVNCAGGACTGGSPGNYVMGGALSEIQDFTYGAITFDDNFVDDTGALYVTYSEDSAVCTSPAAFSNNVLLTTGASVNAWTLNAGVGC